MYFIFRIVYLSMYVYQWSCKNNFKYINKQGEIKLHRNYIYLFITIRAFRSLFVTYKSCCINK